MMMIFLQQSNQSSQIYMYFRRVECLVIYFCTLDCPALPVCRLYIPIYFISYIRALLFHKQSVYTRINRTSQGKVGMYCTYRYPTSTLLPIYLLPPMSSYVNTSSSSYILYQYCTLYTLYYIEMCTLGYCTVLTQPGRQYSTNTPGACAAATAFCGSHALLHCPVGRKVPRQIGTYLCRQFTSLRVGVCNKVHMLSISSPSHI